MIEGSCHCGAVRWSFAGLPESATACNCTVCRRYGVLWAYDYENEGIRVSGPTRAYIRGKALEFHFCPDCGCVAYWRAMKANDDGRRRIAVNLRLAEPASSSSSMVKVSSRCVAPSRSAGNRRRGEDWVERREFAATPESR
jgi:hypothetical protein